MASHHNTTHEDAKPRTPTETQTELSHKHQSERNKQQTNKTPIIQKPTPLLLAKFGDDLSAHAATKTGSKEGARESDGEVGTQERKDGGTEGQKDGRTK